MSSLLHKVTRAIREDRVRISEHAFTRMLERHIEVMDVLEGVDKAQVLEDYTNSRGETRILVLQAEKSGARMHVVREVPLTDSQEAVLVTVYDPSR